MYMIDEIKRKIKGALGIQEVITWEKFFKREEVPFEVFKVLPSKSIRNNQAYVLGEVISSLYVPFSERRSFLKNGTFLTVRSPYRVNFRIIMQPKEVGFYLLIPTEKVREIIRKAEAIYDNDISITKVDINSIPKLNADKAFCTELHYRKNPIFSLDTNRTNNYPLPSILTAVRTLEGDDIAVFDAMFEPYQREKWERESVKAYSLFDQGYIPLDKPGGSILRAIDEAFKKFRYEFADTFTITKEKKIELMKLKNKETKHNEIMLMKKNLSEASKRKPGSNVLKSWLRIAASSEDVGRARSAAYNIANAFADIKGDNELKRIDIPSKWNEKYINAIEKREALPILSNYNKVSTEECGKFIQLPGEDILQEFPQVDHKKLHEVSVPDELTQNIKGVRIGTVSERGITKLVKIPLEAYTGVKLKEVYDALCTASFGQGKQGSGKSEGYGTTWCYDFVTNGLTAIMVDTADGQVLRNFINSLPEDFPDDHIHALNFDNKSWPIAANWSDIYGRTYATNGDEELQALEISERITARFVDFINSLSKTGEFTDRMQQYVISCMRAITTTPIWSFLDLELALTSPAYRGELLECENIKDMPEVVRDLETLQEKAIEEKANAIVDPIVSRAKVLSSTQFMTNLFYQAPKMDQDNKPVLDIRKLMDNEGYGKYGHVIAIQASGDAWGDNQATILGFFLDKINFNAFSRIDMEQNNRKPCLVWIDEPHKVIKTMEDRLAGTSVEFRKYRVKNLFTGHSIEQMGKAANALMDGGSQITSYKTERLSELSRFAHQFAPYDDAKELYEALPEKWKAINSVRLPSGKFCPAFIADMIAPPKEVKDRSYIWEESAKKYGRPWKEVRDSIQDKRKKYQELDAGWLDNKKKEVTERKAKEAEKLKVAKKLASERLKKDEK